jgi:hypothetical protein
MIFFKKKNLRLSKKGLNLVEIVIAIGVSSIALTTTAVFSTALIYESQNNYLTETAVQYQGIIAEQLRLAELDLINVIQTNNTASMRTFTDVNSRNTFCTNTGASGARHYNITLPRIIASTNSIDIGNIQLTQVNSNLVVYQGKQFSFSNIPSDRRIGAFASAETVEIAIRTSHTPTSPVILFEILIRYKVFNRVDFYYSPIFTVNMVKSQVCP